MKVFFFFIGVPTPIFETELELIRKHDKLGDKVYVLQCHGNLDNCHWNKSYSKSKCAECRSRFRNGWNVLNPSNNVHLAQFPVNKQRSDLPQVFDSIEKIRLYRHDGEKIGYGVASSLISRYRDHRFDTHRYRAEIQSTLTTAVQVYETLKTNFEKLKPDLVYVFNGRIAENKPAILLCERMKIKYFTYEVARTLNRYSLRANTTGNNFLYLAEEMEKLWVAGGPDREQVAIKWFEKKRNGGEVERLTSYTKNQTKGLLPKGFDSGKKNIAIFASTIDEYAAIEGIDESIYGPDETEGVRKIIEAFETDNRYRFYLRVHPHMKKISRSRNSQLRDINELNTRFANLHVVWPADVIDTYSLLDACEKTITFGSTIGVEAAYWGKPSILASNLGIYKNLDCIYVPKNHEELIKLLAQDNLPPLPASSALKYGFRTETPQAGIPFKYFKQTGHTSGYFDGVVIEANFIPKLWFKTSDYIRRIKYAIKNPWIIKARFSNKQPD